MTTLQSEPRGEPCKGSFKKYVTEKIAILTPPTPHVTACHVPVDTPSSLHNILARHPSTT